ncbi:MAG: FHA domain-containing protein [Lachnospiraceae bacterium]|nr:FHA domain-containing protein [Lachnospiraceae bacterium]
MKFLHKSMAAFLVVLLAFVPLFAEAKGDARATCAWCGDGRLFVYVKGLGDGPESQLTSIALGDVDCPKPTSRTLDESEPFSTLILVANQKSISTKEQKKASAFIKQVLDNHRPGERFQIASVGKELSYFSEFSDDVEMQKHLLDGLRFDSGKVILSQNLAQAIEDLSKVQQGGFRRILLFASGIEKNDYKKQGTLIENALLKSRVPVYTFGFAGKSNGQDRKRLEQISLDTGADYFDLSKGKSERLAKETLEADAMQAIFEVKLPRKVPDGQVEVVGLTFGEGALLTFPLEITRESGGGVPRSSQGGGGGVILWIVLGLLVAGGVAGGIVFFVTKKKKESPFSTPVEDLSFDEMTMDFARPGSDYPLDHEGTAYLGNEDELYAMADHTEVLFSQQSRSPVTSLGVTVCLQGLDGSRQEYRAYVRDEAIVGRSREADFSVSGDNRIGRRHCQLIYDGGDLFVKDLDSLNKTYVNDQIVDSRVATPLHHGDILSLGKARFQVEIVS